MKRSFLTTTAALSFVTLFLTGCSDPAHHVDLTKYFNAALTNGWHPATNQANTEDNNLRELPRGRQTFAGVEFDVQGLVQLSGRSLVGWGGIFPKEVVGIKVEQKCRHLHFLYGTGWQDADGTAIGQYVVHYASGRKEEVPLIYGDDLRDWWFWISEPQTVRRGVLAWTGANEASRKQGMSLRLYRGTWTNPFPNQRIESVDFVSTMSNSAPFLIALTADSRTRPPEKTKALLKSDHPVGYTPAPSTAQSAPPVSPGAAALLKEAESLVAQRRLDEATEKFRDLVKQDQKNLLFLKRLAACYLEQGRFLSAEENLSQAVALSPTDVQALMLLGQLKTRLIRYDEALEFYNRAAELDPKNAEIQGSLGVTLFRKGRLAEAETALRKAVELDPRNAAAQLNLAAICAMQTPSKSAAALTHYRSALRLGSPRVRELEERLDEAGRDPNVEDSRGATKLVAYGRTASWSRDGKHLVHVKGQDGGIQMLDLASRHETDLTSSGKDPVWSPDGKWVAYVEIKRENPQASEYLSEQVWLVAAAGGSPRFLRQGGFPSWSADGKEVYVHSRHENRLYSVRVDDPNAVPRVLWDQTLSWYPAVSPDGRQVACGTIGKLVIVDVASQQVVRTWPLPTGPGELVAWSPDGKRIAFGGYDSALLGLWVVDMTSGKAVQIADGAYTMPSWSKDGSRLAFDYRWAQKRELWVVSTKNVGVADSRR